MSEATSHLRAHEADAGGRRAITIGQGVSVSLVALDLVLTVLVSVLSGIAYHVYTYGSPGVLESHATLGLMVSIFYLLPRAIGGQYEIAELVGSDPGFRQSFLAWNFAFLCVLVIAFLTKQTGNFSRGTIILFYGAGLGSLFAARAATISLLAGGFARGLIAIRRLQLVGTEDRIASFLERHGTRRYGLQIADVTTLPDIAPDPRSGDAIAGFQLRLQEAVSRARANRVDDILLLVPWSDTRIIDAAIEALMSVPVSIHLGPETVLERFSGVRPIRVGRALGLSLVRPPLGRAELFAKRALDVAAASAGLMLLSPFMLLIALLIKLDSPGPVLFLQRRHGFNHSPFKIIKFRTMSTMEDGSVVQQAAPNDARVTGIGRHLRRWNLDELPQLLNVIKGDMSIVGPRPHALVHNDAFQARIARYARRHNVKPGITGWAQVNGFRGPTDTEAKMRARVEHDLYYIDNWSIWFDIYIMVLTVFSKRAFSNAH